MGQVVIRPKNLDNPLIKGAKKMHKTIGEGEVFNMEGGRAVGEFKSQELPGSVKGYRIKYSVGKRRYIMKDSEGKELNDDEIQKLVKEAYFTYEEGPQIGLPILSADPRNPLDPFFNHSRLGIFLTEGSGVFNPELNASENLVLKGLHATNEFSYTGNSNSASVKFVISDKNQDDNKAAAKVTDKVKAITMFAALTDAKKRSIGKIMNVGINDTTDRAIVESSMFNAINSDKINSEGVPYTQLFIALCEAPSEEINLRELINSAKGEIIKKTKTGYTFRGNRIANTDSGLYDFFKKPDNHELLLSLEEAMGRIKFEKSDD
jgi:hypothetical protein